MLNAPIQHQQEIPREDEHPISQWETLKDTFGEPDTYSKFVAKFPWVMFSLSTSFMLGISLMGLVIVSTTKELSIASAMVGFENRGSKLSGEIMALAHIVREECKGNIMLSSDGTKSSYYSWAIHEDGHNDNPASIFVSECYDGYTSDISSRVATNSHRFNGSKRLSTVSQVDDDGRLSWDPLIISENSNKMDILEGKKEGYSVVFTGADLLSVNALKGMCSIEEKIRSSFGDYSCKDGDLRGTCAASRSLHNYFTALSNVSTCFDLTDKHINEVEDRLKDCKQFYDDGSLVGNCWRYSADIYTSKAEYSSKYPACNLQNTIDQECARYNAVYDLFFALAPSAYDPNVDVTLNLAQMIIPAMDDGAMLDRWFEKMEKMSGMSEGGAMVEIIHYKGIKGQVFSEVVGSEAPLLGVLAILTYFLFVFHSGSFWIATCSISQILFAFLWGYVFYSVILWQDFFPYLNLITLFLVLGVGADDVYVYVDTWRQSFSKLPVDAPLEYRLSWVLSKAGGAMLVTSTTTAVSFLANITSSITTMKAFGLFTAIVVISDFLLMILFLPAVVTIHHLHFSRDAADIQNANDMTGCCVSFPGRFRNSMDESTPEVGLQSHRMHQEEIIASNQNCYCRSCCCCASTIDIDFCAASLQTDEKVDGLKGRWPERLLAHNIAPVILHRHGRWVFLSICLGVSAWLGIHAKNLRRPSSSYMQLLDESHPLEVYDKNLENLFSIGAGESFKYPYQLVWGLRPVDNGDPFNPKSRGTPEYAPLDISSPDAQQYLLGVCEYLAAWDMSPQQTPNLETNPCTFHMFKEWMETKCENTRDASNTNSQWILQYPQRTSCCNYSAFPYSATDFNYCISKFADHFGSKNFNHGLFFDSSGDLKVLLLEGFSTLEYSESFEATDAYYKALKNFFNNRASYLGDPPSDTGLTSGWITTYIAFYAVQKAMAEGAYQSTIIAIIFTLCTLIFMTRRPMTSVLVACQIACVVISVIGVFVLLGFELNIVESVVIAVSVGLSCDFGTHLGVSFNEKDVSSHLEENTPLYFPCSIKDFLQQMKHSHKKAIEAITHLGVTITLGFATTLIAGCVLMGGKAYFFQQFGIFLSTLMAFSFVYAFCLLMPLLGTIGWVDRIFINWLVQKGQMVWSLCSQDKFVYDRNEGNFKETFCSV